MQKTKRLNAFWCARSLFFAYSKHTAFSDLRSLLFFCVKKTQFFSHKCDPWQSSVINARILYRKTNRPALRSQKQHDPLGFWLLVVVGLVAGNALTKRQVQMQPSLVGLAVSDPSQHPIVRMTGRKRGCVQCRSEGTRTKKSYAETMHGCVLCKAHLCKGQCFARFHAQLLQKLSKSSSVWIMNSNDCDIVTPVIDYTIFDFWFFFFFANFSPFLSVSILIKWKKNVSGSCKK